MSIRLFCIFMYLIIFNVAFLGSEARPPRFSKAPEKAAVVASEKRKSEKKKSKEEIEEEEEEEKELQLPSGVLSGSTLDLNIPPVVEVGLAIENLYSAYIIIQL